MSQPERKQGILGAWEDVLDYLTNMGGYTGFTEEELKGLQGQKAGKFEQKDMCALPCCKTAAWHVFKPA